MGERKVLNKYFPPDWDPSLLPKTTKPKNKQQQVNGMLPMSIQCAKCGEYMRKGKKFNGRKEDSGDNYLGIRIYRLYLRCSTCLNEITFLTDPETRDYKVERGASRNFEPWRQSKEEALIEAKQKFDEEKGDAMKVLENRTEASKREMEIADAIEEVRELNARAAALTTDQLLGIHVGAAEQLEEQQIEEMAAKAFANKHKLTSSTTASKTLPDPVDFTADGSAAAASSSSSSSSAPIIKRLPDPTDLTEVDYPIKLTEVDTSDEPAADSAAASSSSTVSAPVAPSTAAAAPLAGLVLVKKRKADDPEREKRKKEKKQKKEKEKEEAAAAVAEDSGTGLAGLLGSYGDDSD